MLRAVLFRGCVAAVALALSVDNSRAQGAGQVDCSSIKAPAARLACFDKKSSPKTSAPKAPPKPSDNASAAPAIPDPPNPPLNPLGTEPEYDEFKKMTIVNYAKREVGTDLSLRGFFVYQGRVPQRPSMVDFILISSSQDWQYLRCHQVDMMADGVPIKLGESSHNGHVGSGYVIEFIAFNMSSAELIKLANANEVRARLCAREFSLGNDDRKALREFASRMKPVPFSFERPPSTQR